MTTATVYCIPTVDQAKLLTVSVNSSAISRLGVVSDENHIAHLLVIFNSNQDKVYRYIFGDDGAARMWYEYLNDDETRLEVSWGKLFDRALKHGDIEPIEV